MDELDKLKGAWKNQDYSKHKVSTNDIYKMLHMKSSSYVKWIFYISIIELGLGFLISSISYFTDSHKDSMELFKELGVYSYYIVAIVISTTVVLYFIYKFYQMFKRIEVSDSVKNLMKTILKTRKIVKQYIYFNLGFAFILIEVTLSFGMIQSYLKIAIDKGEINPVIPLKAYIIGGVLTILIGLIIIGIFWGIYQLLYGILLRRLNKNYKELKQLDK
ncbi:MAG: hypothetical protein COA67_08705 [Lutibacter sp.]|nr:MAG: hypothetical protein COA67_08705 [Lutibacter sp.]